MNSFKQLMLLVLPLLIIASPTDYECKHGEFSCTDYSTRRCNWGKWIDYECTTGTYCIWDDWECVTISDMKAQPTFIHYGADKKKCADLIAGTPPDAPKPSAPVLIATPSAAYSSPVATPEYTKPAPSPAYTKEIEKPVPSYTKPVLIATPTPAKPEYSKPKEEYKPAYTKKEEDKPAYTKKVDTPPTPAYTKPAPTVPVLIASPTPEYTKPEYSKPREEYKQAYTKKEDTAPTPAYTKPAPTVPVLIESPTPEYTKPEDTKPKDQYKKKSKKQYKNKMPYKKKGRKHTKNEYRKTKESTKYEYKTVPDSSCKNGDYDCTDTAVRRCVYGEWVEYTCAAGTHCVWNSWICAGPKAIKNDYIKESYGAEKKPCEELVKDKKTYDADTTPEKEDSECTHGEYSCTDYSTRRCNFGKWVDYACANGSHCVWENYVCADVQTMKTHYADDHYGADKKPCSALINGTVTETPRETSLVDLETPTVAETEATDDLAEEATAGPAIETVTDGVSEASSTGGLAEETSMIEEESDAATATSNLPVATIDVIDSGLAPIGGADSEEAAIPVAQKAASGSRVSLSVLLTLVALALHL